MHVTVDGRGNVNEHWSIRGAYDFCIRSVDLARMKIISGPHTTALRGRIYGHAVLAESHVAIQLDKRTGEAFLEMFSCNDFDADGFQLLAQTCFELKSLAVTRIERGLPPKTADGYSHENADQTR